jgi:hypothetical protein
MSVCGMKARGKFPVAMAESVSRGQSTRPKPFFLKRKLPSSEKRVVRNPGAGELRLLVRTR